MRRPLPALAAAVAVAVPLVATLAPSASAQTLEPLAIAELGRYTGSAAEIAALDPRNRVLWVTDAAGAALQRVDVRDLRNPVLSAQIDLSAYGSEVTSVAVSGGTVAAVVKAAAKDERGTLVVLDPSGAVVNTAVVGFGPDMVTFTPRGDTVLVANEGEPEGYEPGQADPEGSVSVVDLPPGRARQTTVLTAREAGFGAFTTANIDPAVRISGPGSTVAEDIEPEYIAVDPGGRTARVTLQENNAVAVLDVRAARIDGIQALGYADHAVAGHGIDPSDRDGGVNIAPQPVLGMYMPDGIAAFRARGKTYYATANEGDSREYGDYADDARVSSLPNSGLTTEQRSAAQLGRLTVTTVDPYVPGGPLYSYGSRSFSIRDDRGALVFDSGDAFEQITAEQVPELFNSDKGDPDEFDARSDNKGPEPEGIAVGTVRNRTYAFVGLERVGGVMVYDVTDPANATLERYVAGGVDVAPEGIQFIPRSASLASTALLVVSHEGSATTTLFEVG